MWASSGIGHCVKQASGSRHALISRCVASAASTTTTTDTSNINDKQREPHQPPRTSTRPRASNPFRFQTKSYYLRKQSLRASRGHGRKTEGAGPGKKPPHTTNHERKSALHRKQLVKNRFSEPLVDNDTTAASQEQETPETKLTTSCWVKISNIPILSTLDDTLNIVNNVLDFERERGITDLDANNRQQGGSLPLLDLSETQDWVISARLFLSRSYRPSGWQLKFANRSIAHSLLQHSKEMGLTCAWKPVLCQEWNPDDSEQEQEVELRRISDATVRIENCTDKITVENLRHILRRFDLSTEPNSIQQLTTRFAEHPKKPFAKHPKFEEQRLFLVHFADASWARAAVRELQGIVVDKRELRFCQYPKQRL